MNNYNIFSHPHLNGFNNLSLHAQHNFGMAQPAQTSYCEPAVSSPSRNTSKNGARIVGNEESRANTSRAPAIRPQKQSKRLPQRQIEKKSCKKLRDAHEKLAKTLNDVGVAAQGKANVVDTSARLIEALVRRTNPLHVEAALREVTNM